MSNFKKSFSGTSDPRVIGRIKHLLSDIIGLSLIATIVGCEGYEDIEDFGKEKQEWLQQYLELPNGIPSHDTMERLFGSVNPKEFNACFCSWYKKLLV